ncbi:MAG TPA: carboxypeptidase-like regulatory domain-containing protein [Pyrinomonadaceae bacterium]|nr:carboxypeptidase-like regulatory domain-containing protein [Pyrinomonadaceae bacterium]
MTKSIPTGGRIGFCLSSLFLSLLVCASVFAQSGRSTVRGTVRDPQGGAVAGATITLTNAEKNFTRTQTSNEEGGYVFTAVPPGTYQLEAESTGFKKVSVADVHALVDTPVDVDVQLEVGNVSETVSVTGANEAALNTSDATIGNAFENRRIQGLPLNARNVVGLLSLQPGVTRSGYVNGGRADQANVTLDGVDVNEQQRGLDIVTDEAFASVLRTTPDSLQEFRVTTTNPNADQGRSSGAQVSLVTKSGSNDWHGSLFEYHRNTVTTANDFFNNAAGVERPQLLRNIYGGSIGGPIKKDKLFFFGTYEGFREATATSVLRQVPLPSLGQGIVKYVVEPDEFGHLPDGNFACPTTGTPGRRCLALNTSQINQFYTAANGVTPGINQNALAALAAAAARYPANDSGAGDGLNTSGYRFNATTPARLNTYITRLDANLTDRQTLFFRGNYQWDHVTHSVYGSTDCGTGDNIQCFPDTPALTLWNHPWGVAVGHSWTLSNSLVNRVSYGFTRAAFTDQGDANGNFYSFRFIFRPLGFKGTLSRTTPVHNFIDDLSWIKGSHTLQIGGNVRLITNNRTSDAASFDNAIANPSYYDCSGFSVILDNVDCQNLIFPNVASGAETDLRDALTAVIGRFSQYGAGLVYDQSGKLQPVGTPTTRSFATQEYELYLQDSWRWRPNFTLNYGVRWSTSTPVYERNGFQVKPTQSLGRYFEQRVASADKGVPFNDPITLDLAGKANNRPGFYEQDWNNFAPSVSFAWSPDFGNNFLGKLLGNNGRSVVRGGYRMTFDRIGSQLAVSFDLNNSLGFVSTSGVSANTFNVSDRLAPLFAGANPQVRNLLIASGVSIPGSISFPLTRPSDEDQRIEQSLDDTLTTPYNHSVSLSYGREIGRGLSFEASYVGRFGRNLLASRDIMQLNNIRDPQSGMTWYEAANKLVDLRYAAVPISSVQPIPFFENLFPGLARPDLGQTATQRAYRRFALPSVGGLNSTDYTFTQLVIDDQPIAKFNNTFYQPQYAALSVYSTIARSNFNSAQFSIRQRLRNDIQFDFNYTFSHSLDNASGLQAATAYSSAGFILNALDPGQNYADSDFDSRHIINANWLVGLPVGRGRALLGNANKVVNGILGGWTLTGIFRFNTGLPIVGAPVEADRWATNWNAQSNGVRVRAIQSSPGDVDGSPNLFADPTAALQSFRDARPGEVGDRNVLRAPGYVTLDAGLYKSFRLPWEGQRIEFRWEVYNVTNTQRFDGSTIADLSLPQDPFIFKPTAGSDFGRFTSTQTPLNETKAGRVMQFALRYEF